jgi:hypothetical protein
LALPQAAQRHGRGAPQSPQNRLPSGAVIPQRRQSIVLSSALDRLPPFATAACCPKQTRQRGGRNRTGADFQLAQSGLCGIVLMPYRHPANSRGDVSMNAVIRKVSGTYSVVQFVPDDKLDQLASLLGLDDTQKAKLKTTSPVIVVLDDEGKSAG